MEEYKARNPSPILIHTTLVKTTLLLEKVLEDNNYKKYDPKSHKQSPYTFAIITGESTDSFKQQVLDTYNSKDNKHGQVLGICIITIATGTGVTFRNTRQLHIVEPFWNFSYLQQVTGRAVRNNVFDGPFRRLAHANPTDPIEPRPKVKVFAYMSVPPEGQVRMTPDQEIYQLMMRKMQYVESYSHILELISIEAPLAPDGIATHHSNVSHKSKNSVQVRLLDRPVKTAQPLQPTHKKRQKDNPQTAAKRTKKNAQTAQSAAKRTIRNPKTVAMHTRQIQKTADNRTKQDPRDIVKPKSVVAVVKKRKRDNKDKQQQQSQQLQQPQQQPQPQPQQQPQQNVTQAPQQTKIQHLKLRDALFKSKSESMSRFQDASSNHYTSAVSNTNEQKMRRFV